MIGRSPASLLGGKQTPVSTETITEMPIGHIRFGRRMAKRVKVSLVRNQTSLLCACRRVHERWPTDAGLFPLFFLIRDFLFVFPTRSYARSLFIRRDGPLGRRAIGPPGSVCKTSRCAAFVCFYCILSSSVYRSQCCPSFFPVCLSSLLCLVRYTCCAFRGWRSAVGG